MSDHEPEDPDETSPLAELSEQITRRLQAGDPVEPEDLLDQDPSCSGPIQGLLPTLRELAELGRSISLDRRARKSPGPKTRDHR